MRVEFSVSVTGGFQGTHIMANKMNTNAENREKKEKVPSSQGYLKLTVGLLLKDY